MSVDAMPFSSTSRSMVTTANYTAMASDLAASCSADVAPFLSSASYAKNCWKLSPLVVNKPGYQMNLDVCSANFDTLLAVFGCRTTVDGRPYNCMCVSNDDSPSTCGLSATQSAVHNVTYEIGVEYYAVVVSAAKG